jgi:hypothetical protein
MIAPSHGAGNCGCIFHSVWKQKLLVLIKGVANSMPPTKRKPE